MHLKIKRYFVSYCFDYLSAELVLVLLIENYQPFIDINNSVYF